MLVVKSGAFRQPDIHQQFRPFEGGRILFDFENPAVPACENDYREGEYAFL